MLSDVFAFAFAGVISNNLFYTEFFFSTFEVYKKNILNFLFFLRIN